MKINIFESIYNTLVSREDTSALIIIFVCGFAAYRVGRMVAREEGPFNIFLKFRMKMALLFGESPKWFWINDGFSCQLCISFWASILLLYIPFIVVLWFAIAGVAAVMFDSVDRDV